MRFYPHSLDLIASMISDKYFTPARLLLLLSFFVFSFSKINAQDGKAIFVAKCNSCHILGKDFTGPNLQGVVDRWGGDTKAIKTWILNWEDAVKAGNPEAVQIQNFSTSAMQKFAGTISDAELNAVIKYVNEWTPPPISTDGGGGGQTSSGGGGLIFGIISLIMALIALILMQ